MSQDDETTTGVPLSGLMTAADNAGNARAMARRRKRLAAAAAARRLAAAQQPDAEPTPISDLMSGAKAMYDKDADTLSRVGASARETWGRVRRGLPSLGLDSALKKAKEVVGTE